MPEQLREVVRPTTIIEAPRLGERLGVKLVLASETFQHTGSFKFRAAYNVASKVPQNLLIAASSGNFGQALAYACSVLKKACIVVMPASSATVKVRAVREYGGTVQFVDVRSKSRAARVAELAKEHPEAYIASAYDDPLVIEGNASLGVELAALPLEFDYVVVPVGGGGLSSGVIVGIAKSVKKTLVVGAEPRMGNDLARSIREGKLVANETEPQTIADGARTISVGRHNWEILRRGLHSVEEVPEDKIAAGVRDLFEFANLKAEPTAALGIGALLSEPEKFQGSRVCCVISGGNVDAEVYSRLISR
jgi:threonine dehydratase